VIFEVSNCTKFHVFRYFASDPAWGAYCQLLALKRHILDPGKPCNVVFASPGKQYFNPVLHAMPHIYAENMLALGDPWMLLGSL